MATVCVKGVGKIKKAHDKQLPTLNSVELLAKDFIPALTQYAFYKHQLFG